MRRRIGVFMGEVTSTYQKTVLTAIYQKADELNYDVFVFVSFGSYGDNVLYAEGEKGIIRLPDLRKFDGFIVAEDTFDIEGMGSELEVLMKEVVTCPVVYLRNKSDFFYNIRIGNKRAMASMTRHFVEDHGFRDICFMKGKTTYTDAIERFEGFLDVMEEAGIEVTEHMVFNGDYWREKGHEAVEWFMEGRDTYPQAIICSNDYMALSICEELKKRGVRIPEDVCVSGFDDVLEASTYQPSISSLRVPFDKMAAKAVEMIDNVLEGRDQKRIEWVQLDLQLRKSCNCGVQENMIDWAWMMDRMYHQDYNMQQLVFMTTDYQEAFEETEYLRIAEKYFYRSRCQRAYLCLCNEQEENFEAVENDNVYSERMVLRRVFYSNKKADICTIEFDRSDLLPPEIMEKETAHHFLFFSIHYKNKCYGYMVMIFEGDHWPDTFTQAYMMSLANAIEDSVIHHEVSSMEEIRMLYQMDALTGILNRRGYEKQLRAQYEKMAVNNKYLSIVSIDMDGLKFINDNFGHAEGDDALQRLAEVLKNLTRAEEVCARVGGDEFSVLLLSDTRERHKDFEYIFRQAIKEEDAKVEKPYPFHASIGICCINEEPGLSLMACMQLADKRMYMEKRKNKMARENLKL